MEQVGEGVGVQGMWGPGPEGQGRTCPALGADSSPCSWPLPFSPSWRDLRQDPAFSGLHAGALLLQTQWCSVLLGQMRTERRSDMPWLRVLGHSGAGSKPEVDPLGLRAVSPPLSPTPQLGAPEAGLLSSLRVRASVEGAAVLLQHSISCAQVCVPSIRLALPPPSGRGVPRTALCFLQQTRGS